MPEIEYNYLVCRHLDGRKCSARGGACPFAVSALEATLPQVLACELVNDRGVQAGMMEIAKGVVRSWGRLNDGAGNPSRSVAFGIVKQVVYEMALGLETGDEVAVLAHALVNQISRRKGESEP